MSPLHPFAASMCSLKHGDLLTVEYHITRGDNHESCRLQRALARCRETVDDPRIEKPDDAIVKITSAAICGSDLHMYEGSYRSKPGTVFGHENMGIVAEVGPGITSLKVGDRVVLPFNIACGFCFNCLRGYTSACLTVNEAAPHAAYGYADMGPFKGGQAEYLRVPYADFNALKLPGQPGDQWEDDFVTLADIWPTGYHGTELAGVRQEARSPSSARARSG